MKARMHFIRAIPRDIDPGLVSGCSVISSLGLKEEVKEGKTRAILLCDARAGNFAVGEVRLLVCTAKVAVFATTKAL